MVVMTGMGDGGGRVVIGVEGSGGRDGGDRTARPGEAVVATVMAGNSEDGDDEGGDGRQVVAVAEGGDGGGDGRGRGRRGQGRQWWWLRRGSGSQPRGGGRPPPLTACSTQPYGTCWNTRSFNGLHAH